MRLVPSVGLVIALVMTGCGSDGDGSSSGTGGMASTSSSTGGGATPIELGWACTPGEVQLSDGTCRAPGVPPEGCGDGFVHDGDAGCAPVLPEAACPVGMTALPGDETCRLVAPCPAETWGGIPPEPGMLYVQAGAAPGGGTIDDPYPEIQDAVAAAPDGTLIAVAAGVYSVPVSLGDKALRIWGVCPSEARLEPMTTTGAAIGLANADGSVIRGLGLGHAAVGLSLFESSAEVRDLWVYDTTGQGVVVTNLFTAPLTTVQNLLVEGAVRSGFQVARGRVEVEDIEVRQVTSDALFGYGISAGSESNPLLPRELTVRRAHVHHVRDIGILGLTADLTLEDSYVHDVLPSGVEPILGRHGISISNGTPEVTRTATIRRTVVERVDSTALHAVDVDVEVEAVVLRDVVSTDRSGAGLLVQQLSRRPTISVRDSLVERANVAGVHLVGDGEVVGVVVRDGTPSAFSPASEGLFVGQSPIFDVEGVLIEDAVPFGLRMAGGDVRLRSIRVEGTRAFQDTSSLAGALVVHQDELALDVPGLADIVDVWVTGNDFLGVAIAERATLRGARVEGSRPHPADGTFGDGVVVISFFQDSEITEGTIDGSEIMGNERAGLAAFGANVEFNGNALGCNGFDLNGENAPGDDFAFSGDGNQCGCDLLETCKALSSGLEPPPPPFE